MWRAAQGIWLCVEPRVFAVFPGPPDDTPVGSWGLQFVSTGKGHPIPPPRQVANTRGRLVDPLLTGSHGGGGGGVGTRAMVLVGLPLAAPIGLSPLLILTLCGSELGLVV